MFGKPTVAAAMLLVAGCGLKPAGTVVAQFYATANGPVEFEFPVVMVQVARSPASGLGRSRSWRESPDPAA